MRPHPAAQRAHTAGETKGLPAERTVSGVFPVRSGPTRGAGIDRSEPGASDAIAAAIASALSGFDAARPTTKDVTIAPETVQRVQAEEGAAPSVRRGLPSRTDGVTIGAMLGFAVAVSAAILVFFPKPDVIPDDFEPPAREASASPRSAAVAVAVAVAPPLVVPPPLPTPEVTSSPSAFAAPPSADATTGTITLPSSAGGHRIYVDGRLTAARSSSVLVRECGSHVVKIGSRGRNQVVLVPCGGEVAVAYP